MLRIVPFPHPALRYESRPVTRIDDGLRAVVREMFELMYEHNGIGLAANQVGIPLRFFVLNLSADPEQPDQEQVFINPEIVKRHAATESEEGCLSFPGIYAKVKRARKVKVRAFDLNGNPIEVEADDLLGRALQHEIDHLDGRLFIDHVTPATLNAIAPKVREVEAGYRRDQAEGIYPDDAKIAQGLAAQAESGTASLEPTARA